MWPFRPPSPHTPQPPTRTLFGGPVMPAGAVTQTRGMLPGASRSTAAGVLADVCATHGQRWVIGRGGRLTPYGRVVVAGASQECRQAARRTRWHW